MLDSVTGTLGLPPAPNLFGGAVTAYPSPVPGAVVPDWSAFPFLDVPSPPLGDAPQLYPFQEEGVQFLLDHPVALLGDEMGLGKSVQAIAALRELVKRGEVGRALVLSPKTLLFDWWAKFRLWAPDLKVITVDGKRRSRGWYWQAPAHVHLAGYETWREDLKARLPDPAGYDLAILDEIQRIKNPGTATHRAVSTLGAVRRWGLSGTPMENRVEELLAIFSFLKPGLLPYERNCPPAQVRKAIAPYLLRRRKADVLALPPKECRTVWLELDPVQRIAYEEAERSAVQALKQAGACAAPMIALALLTRLKQICNLEDASGASAKLSYLDSELGRITTAGEKALIFSQYPDKTLKPLLPRLERHGAALFDGTLSDWSRQMLVNRFQHHPDPRVLAISLKCGGVGITLTRANHVFHFDHWWNPAAAAQAEDRTHRIGQEKPVLVTTLLTRGTVEERIAELLEQKRELIEQVIGPLTADAEASEELAVARNLSRDELLGLFGMRP